jgi:hypothetical protein
MLTFLVPGIVSPLLTGVIVNDDDPDKVRLIEREIITRIIIICSLFRERTSGGLFFISGEIFKQFLKSK